MQWEESRLRIQRVEVETRLTPLDECVHTVSHHVVQAFPESRRGAVFQYLMGDSLIPISVQILREVLCGWVIRPFNIQDPGRVDGRCDVPRSIFLNDRLRGHGRR